MGVLEPSGNGLYLLPHNPYLPPSPSQDTARSHGPRVALTAQCDPVLWHRRFGHLNMQSLQAQHTHGVPTSPALACSLKLFLAIHAYYTKPRMHHATPLLARNLPVPSSTCPLTSGDKSTSPLRMTSASACSLLTTTPITCGWGCGSSSQKTMRV
jgi:hypothetical protein